MRYCENCGAPNEADVRFCVNCGAKLSDVVAAPTNQAHAAPAHHHAPANHAHASDAPVQHAPYAGSPIDRGYADVPYQNSAILDSEVSERAHETMNQTTSLVKMIWDRFLFPERMIVIGAVMGCVAAIFWGTAIFLLSAFYFLTMILALALIYLSKDASLLKRIELSRWQIVIGTFWLPLGIVAMQIMSSVYGIMSTASSLYGSTAGSSSSLYGAMSSSSSAGSLTFSLWLSLFSSILILTGGIMLQGLLVRHVFNQKR